MKNEYKTLSQSGIGNGDRVMIIYKDSSDFMQTGIVVSIVYQGPYLGDCSILLDYQKNVVEYHYSNLIKIEQIIELPTGEILNISATDALDLAILGLIKYNNKKNYCYFFEDDRNQINRYVL